MAKADYVWITIDTPIDENDVCSLDSIEAIMQKLSDLPIKNYMISSQVPIGTTEKLLTDAQIRMEVKSHIYLKICNLEKQ